MAREETPGNYKITLGETSYSFNPFRPGTKEHLIVVGRFEDALKGKTYQEAIDTLLLLRKERTMPPFPLSTDPGSIDPLFSQYWEYMMPSDEALTALVSMLKKAGFQEKDKMGIASHITFRCQSPKIQSTDLAIRIMKIVNTVYGGTEPPPFPPDHFVYKLIQGKVQEALGKTLPFALKRLASLKEEYRKGRIVVFPSKDFYSATLRFLEKPVTDPAWALALCELLREAGFTEREDIEIELEKLRPGNPVSSTSMKANLETALDAVFPPHAH